MGISWSDVHDIPIRILAVMVGIDRSLKKEAARDAVAIAKKKGVQASVDLGQFAL